MNTTHIPLPKDKLAYWVENDGDRAVLHQPVNGQYKTYNWKQISDNAHRLYAFLKRQGLNKGDTVAILSKNCAEWIIADLALMLGGYVSIPIYPTANAETISYILQHAECKFVIVGKLDDWKSVEQAIPKDIPRVSMPYQTMPAEFKWQDIMAEYEPDYDVPEVEGSDLMTILYTSGSTGDPKGAMHSYDSFVRSGKNTGASMQATPQDRILSYLPMSHCTERNYVCSVFINYGFNAYFVESLETFADNLTYANPTVFGSVPRLWTQFQKKILHKLPNRKLQLLLKIPVVSSIVKNKIKKQMGLSSARVFLSGSAPLSEKLLQWYKKLDIHIAEGWGMTETFACGCLPGPNTEVRFGTISQPGFEVDIKIAEDDEILLKSTSAMMGYFKDEEKSREILRSDGFFHTGDLGKMEDGYVSIVGRKKDIFKTEKGKYVAPIPIESEFAENEYIEQMCLMGTHLVQPVLIANLSSHAEGVDREILQESLANTMRQINEKLESHEKVGGIIVTNTNWTTESGELTPTLKVKRHVVEKQYLDEAQKVKPGQVIWQ